MNVFITGATSGLGRVNIFLPVFLKRKKGIFVAISSLSTYRAINANRIAYPASKSDLTMVFEAIRIQFISRPLRFISFQIGRMGEGQTLLQASYKRAAEKIANHLSPNKKKDVVDFPFIQAVLMKISKFLPDFVITKVQRTLRY